MLHKHKELSRYIFAKCFGWSENGTSVLNPRDGITFQLHSESFYSVKLGFISLISNYLDAMCGTCVYFFSKEIESHQFYAHSYWKKSWIYLLKLHKPNWDMSHFAQ